MKQIDPETSISRGTVRMLSGISQLLVRRMARKMTALVRSKGIATLTAGAAFAALSELPGTMAPFTLEAARKSLTSYNASRETV